MASAATPGVHTLIDMLERSARSHPEQRLHFSANEQISFRELAIASRDYATGLRACGMARGSCVGLLIPTSVDFIVTFFGVLRCGAAVAPLALPRGFNEAATLPNRLARLSNALDLLVVDPLFASRLRAASIDSLPVVTPRELLATPGPSTQPVVDAADLAVIQYTSGSTSSPRGVALTHANVLAGCEAIADGMQLSDSDVLGAWLPLFHDMGLVGLLAGILRGVEQYHSSPAAFVKDPSSWIRRFSERRATVFTGPNFAFEQLLQRVTQDDFDRLDLSRWRVAFNGGEPIDPVCLSDFVARFSQRGFRASTMIPCYGMAEATLAVTFPDFATAPEFEWVERSALANERRVVLRERGALDAKGLVCVGKPVLGMTVEIRDERRAPCPEHRVGEICIRGPSVTSGYYRNQEATTAAMRDGFLHTGDLGYWSDGKLYVTGRQRQMIIVRGENYYPEDIEAAVRTTTGLYQQRCVALKPDDGSECVCILAEAKAVNAAEELRENVRRAAAREFPGVQFDVRIVAPRTLQQTSSGKYQRLLMRELLRNGELGERTREARRAAGGQNLLEGESVSQ